MSTQPLAAAAGDLSREDRERLVEQRMENMRLKNEELLRRHAEVEADKKNADLLSSAALKENALRKPPPPPVATTAVSEKRSSKPRVPRVRPVPPRDSETQRMQRLSLEDGPPPDPNYRFLADRMREGGDGGGEGAGGGSRRHRDNYGGQDFENVRHAMRQDKALQRESGGHALPPKLAMTGRQRREYEQWKSDRASIDQERMQRHMDAEGHFTREWDLHKEHQLGPPSPPSEHRGSSCQGSRIYLREICHGFLENSWVRLVGSFGWSAQGIVVEPCVQDVPISVPRNPPPATPSPEQYLAALVQYLATTFYTNGPISPAVMHSGSCGTPAGGRVGTCQGGPPRGCRGSRERQPRREATRRGPETQRPAAAAAVHSVG